MAFKQVTEIENELLVAPFTIEEIREAVWECDGNKSPRPDGFNLIFFKKCWDVASSEIFGFFEEFHHQASIPKAVSASFIALVSKNSNPQSVTEYRPSHL